MRNNREIAKVVITINTGVVITLQKEIETWENTLKTKKI